MGDQSYTFLPESANTERKSGLGPGTVMANGPTYVGACQCWPYPTLSVTTNQLQGGGREMDPTPTNPNQTNSPQMAKGW